MTLNSVLWFDLGGRLLVGEVHEDYDYGYECEEGYPNLKQVPVFVDVQCPIPCLRYNGSSHLKTPQADLAPGPVALHLAVTEEY